MSQKQQRLVISCLNIVSFDITAENIPFMDSHSTIFRNLQNTSEMYLGPCQISLMDCDLRSFNKNS